MDGLDDILVIVVRPEKKVTLTGRWDSQSHN